MDRKVGNAGLENTNDDPDLAMASVNFLPGAIEDEAKGSPLK